MYSCHLTPTSATSYKTIWRVMCMNKKIAINSSHLNKKSFAITKKKEEKKDAVTESETESDGDAGRKNDYDDKIVSLYECVKSEC